MPKPENVFAVEAPVTMDEDGITYLKGHLKKLEPDLVIIDPLVAYMGEKVNMDKANQTRKVMASLAAVAEKHHCAIVTIRHLSKGTQAKAIFRGLGSIDITAACRSVLMVGLNPEDDNRRIIAHAKCNLAQLGPSLSYTIADGRFEWTGEVDVSAEQLCAAPADDEARTALEEAMQFIEGEMTVS